MSRAAPSWETLDAVSQALDARDRRSNRPVLPIRPAPARPLMPGEIAARLRGIRNEIGSALAADAGWERDLVICTANRQITTLIEQIEGTL